MKTVYFELYGKKMKTSVKASSDEEAKKIIKEKIIFHKIQDAGNSMDDISGFLDDFLEALKKGPKNNF